MPEARREHSAITAEARAALSTAVEKKFSTFRAKVDGKEMADADIRKVLKNSGNSARRREGYEASKEGGRVVETWSQWDTLTFMRDLGAIPEQAAASAGS